MEEFTSLIIIIRRLYKKPTYVIGTLDIEGYDAKGAIVIKEKVCNTLELPEGPTGGIPPGRYPVFTNRSSKLDRITPLILDVEGRTEIRIHAGNTVADTEGCILVGSNTKPGELTEARVTENALTATIASYCYCNLCLTNNW